MRAATTSERGPLHGPAPSALVVRVTTSLVGLPLVLGLLLWGNAVSVRIVFSMFAAVTAWEMARLALLPRLASHAAQRPVPDSTPLPAYVGGAVAWVLFFVAATVDEGLAAATLVMGLVAAYLAGVFGGGDADGRVERGQALLFSVLYAAVPWLTIWWLYAAAGRGNLLLLALAVAWGGDTAAYAVGRTFGRTPLAPRLSPKKTWEGAVAGILGAVLAAVIVDAAVGPLFPTRTWLLASVVFGAVAGQLGDLLKSIYKRRAGVKDAGRLVPGHGGLIDRIDSLLFAAPVLYLAQRLAGGL